MSTAIEHLTEKLAQLPPERLAEVVDFLAESEHERNIVRAAQAASEASLTTIWNNDVDAVYDRL